ncbi:hypothetical protein AMS68_004660 [Peltaster fructicola]|uniref:protein kinase C n=1 Tax=Peltaster fructicola TaxID=286661 RepID=A0A6H0XWL5_9PEZI|nr:hypothetical protein AMS68_004660 [Peltaster fructicola]
MSNQDTIQNINNKIKREHDIINAAIRFRAATNNPAVNSRADSQIRDAKRNIAYFEQTLKDLQGGVNSLSLTGNGKPQHAQASDYGPGGYSDGNGLMPPRAPFAPAGGQDRSPAKRPNYSKLDLIKDDTAHLGPRIQLMLSQLEFKLSVEKQYKDGIEKMVRLYQMEGDRKSKADAEGKKVESNQKIHLLQQALKRYEELHVADIDIADANDDDSLDMPTQRKPLSGHLSIRIQGIEDVDHASTGRFSRGPETFVIMKVEDSAIGRTKATRSDRWTDEVHEIDVDKANEIEFTVYDKSGDRPVPIGLLWIRIADLVDEIRRKRVETEFNQAGWTTADKMSDGQPRPDLHFNPPPGSQGVHPPSAAGGFGAGMQQSGPIFIDTWFSLEPVGRIHLTLGFIKQTRDRRPFEAALGRKGAVRQKKEDVIEQYGHKFTLQTFYNIMRCAYCGDLLKYTPGMQCSDCKYTCHQKCYPRVVTKCISKSNAETDPDEEKINHRIPHRFEAFSNVGANWCCHCGYMLPLGKKQSRRCHECKLTCHANCVHFVPDFCGMSMESANQILTEMKNTRARQQPGGLRPVSAAPPGRPLASTQPSYAPSPAEQDLMQKDDGSGRPFSYGSNKNRTSDQYDPKNSLNAAATAMTTGSQPTSPEQTRPQASRAQSSNSAALAAAAASYALANQSPKVGIGSRDRLPIVNTSQESKALPSHPVYDPKSYVPLTGTPTTMVQPPIIQHKPLPTPAKTPYQPMGSPMTPQIIAPPQMQTSITAPVREERKPAPPANTPGTGRRIGLDHFNFLAVLGKGNFGKVMLAETKTTKQLYAIKVLKKEFIIENDEVESTRSEKRVFLIANKERHPFLLNLHACFQTETRVYFVMEYISGGDLMWHIQRGQFGTKRAQFYAAEVCLALKYFHENGVIYRDLKLDNILLTLDGHIKIGDYGLCKEDMWYGSTTSTFCGTPEFMAPEILLDKKYGRAVDWWAFGVLIYQMLLQQSPFRGEDEDEIYDAILADEPLYPIHMPRDSVSILQKLLTREPEMRLGSGPTDAQEIMSHAFFRGVDWEDVYNKRVSPPFIPTIKGRADTSNFDSEFTSVTPVLTPVQSVLSQAMQEEFRGFSYSADFV